MFLRVFVLLILGLAATTPAMAFRISQKMSMAQLESTCSKAGGQYVNEAGVFGTCTKKNCDGKGGDCKVMCDTDSNCVGSTPNALKDGQTLLSILQNGDMVLHELHQAPPASLSSSGEVGAAAPAAPAGPSGSIL